ncbi:hypothetical protein L218DRAFT_921838 [Marasmius fiardii PR-910]|nr:hypothetical protein L218DRAFT_921838 [Marasmius fiardii PR-910]
MIFPSNSFIEDALSSLKRLKYAKGKVSLVKLVEKPGDFVKSLGYSSDVSVLSMPADDGNSATEDVWCIDNRGVLTLSVCEGTYQRLGLVGERVKFGKAREKRMGAQGDGRYVITLPLQPHVESERNRARRNECLRRLEERRLRERDFSEDGHALTWTILCSPADEEILSRFVAEHLEESEAEIRDISYEFVRRENVKIPIFQIPERPKPSRELDGQSKVEDSTEDYEESIGQLLEWIGMAGLNSQRLQANDRVDPFIAVYEPPSRSRIGSLTHVKWTGLLSPSFVQSVIDFVMTHIHSPSTSSPDPHWLSVVGHACTWSPICYIPPSLLDSPGGAPIRDPSRGEEDTWCLVVTLDPTSTSEEGKERWLLAESVGKHDQRWG